MKYAIAFGILGIYLLTLGCVLEGAGRLFLWPGFSLTAVAAGYAGLGPAVFGKRANGSLAWWAVLLLLPYFLLTWTVWHVQRLMSREPCCNEIAPGLWIGRRSFAEELPKQVSLIVDVTAEFAEPREVRTSHSYLCLPILDALAPDERELRNLVERITAWQGGVFIHCAVGHGRSALVATAVLMKRGLAANPRQAEELIRKARPSVRLYPAQRRLLEKYTALGRPFQSPTETRTEPR